MKKRTNRQKHRPDAIPEIGTETGKSKGKRAKGGEGERWFVPTGKESGKGRASSGLAKAKTKASFGFRRTLVTVKKRAATHLHGV